MVVYGSRREWRTAYMRDYRLGLTRGQRKPFAQTAHIVATANNVEILTRMGVPLDDLDLNFVDALAQALVDAPEEPLLAIVPDGMRSCPRCDLLTDRPIGNCGVCAELEGVAA